MTIRFRCPHCQKPLGVKDHLAGKKAACPLCKKHLVIPKLQAPAVPVSTPAQPELPPEEVESLAAAALGEAPQEEKNGAAAETIDFKCPFCDTELHLPESDGGKRLPCPECRNIVRIPAAADKKKKDWRDVAKKGPTIADMQAPDKIDAAAWGTQTDKGRVSTKAMEEAGALPQRKVRQPVGPRGWIRRVLWTTAILGGAIAFIIAGRSITFKEREKAVVAEMLTFVDGEKPAVTNPLLRAEIHRAIGVVKIREGEAVKALEPLRRAWANAKSGQAKGPDHDLFFVDLALTQLEMGGSEDEVIAKFKLSWKDTIRDEQMKTLRAVKDLSARVIAVRAVATRLWEKDQKELAVSLAAQLNNETDGRLLGQLITLTLMKDQPVDNLVKSPDGVKEPEYFQRIGYAEFHARKGNADAARELANRSGPPLERLEALLGAAAIFASDPKTAEGLEKAAPLVDDALEIAKGQKYRLPVWYQWQLVRLGARVKGSESVKELVANSRSDFKPRAHLEVILAECDKQAAPVPLALLEAKDFDKASLAYDLAWEAVARQHARVGSASDVETKAKEFENGRVWPLARTGAILGAQPAIR